MSTPYFDDKLGMVFIKYTDGAKPAEHCRKCLRAAEILCDYPVGRNKTCDAPMCHHHSVDLGRDIHYCEAHYKEYRGFMASGDYPNILLFRKRQPKARQKP